MKIVQKMKFVLKSAKSGKYIALDQSTGGYPVEHDDIWLARFWDDPTDAMAYTAVMSWNDYDHPVFTLEVVALRTEGQYMPTGEELSEMRK